MVIVLLGDGRDSDGDAQLKPLLTCSSEKEVGSDLSNSGMSNQ
jgi:hypothetical protein